jgi:hypothetical protein
VGVEATEGMEWLLWLIEKTSWLLEPQGICFVGGILVVCFFEFYIRRPRKK